MSIFLDLIIYTLNKFEETTNKRYNEVNNTFRVEIRCTMKENRETISNLIGERIRKFRTEQKLSQEELLQKIFSMPQTLIISCIRPATMTIMK